MVPVSRDSRWLERLAVAAWSSGCDRRIRELNAPAAELFGREAGACVGRPCAEVVSAVLVTGEPFCAALCPVRREREAGLPCRPFGVRIRARPLWLLSLPSFEDAAWEVVHLALDDGQDRRALEHLARIAHEDGFHSRPDWERRHARLTPRQREILELLCAHESPAAIARRIHRSLATVRNHVQRLLTVLEVHSVQQAVALCLLHGGGAPRE